MSDSAGNSMTYGQYLGLDQLLSAQHPVSDRHDELLFIVMHQTKELWLKQIIHELKLAIGLIRKDRLSEVYKNLARVSRIQAVMTLSWDVLATMTPADYMSFRGVLGASSGFQSAQFRQIEFLLGIKSADYLRYQDSRSAEYASVEAALNAPSLWDETIAAAARAGLEIPARVLKRDWRETYQPDEGVEAAWLIVYREPDRWWDLYELAEKLVDIDEAFCTWRYKHVMTVERIIGFKQGTGGTPGVPYLRSTLGKRAFPELWSLRTKI